MSHTVVWELHAMNEFRRLRTLDPIGAKATSRRYAHSPTIPAQRQPAPWAHPATTGCTSALGACCTDRRAPPSPSTC